MQQTSLLVAAQRMLRRSPAQARRRAAWTRAKKPKEPKSRRNPGEVPRMARQTNPVSKWRATIPALRILLKCGSAGGSPMIGAEST
jgi:hypothetical protein